jgi:hypothetical protein
MIAYVYVLSLEVQQHPSPTFIGALTTSQAMTTLETLNSEAMKLFAQGAWKDASKVFNEALKQIAPQVTQLCLCRGDENDSAEIALTCVPVALNVAAPDERIFPLFPQGLHYADLSADPCTSEYQRVAAVTCYNIGLCNHILGLADPRSLQKAMRAYRHARDILDTCTMYINASSEDVKLIALAIANNVGHILELTYEKDRALNQLRELDNILASASFSPQLLDFHLTSSLFSRTECCYRLHAPAA